MIVLAIVSGLIIAVLVAALFVVKAGSKKAVDAAVNNFAKEMQLKLLEAAAQQKAEAVKESAAVVSAIPTLSDKQLEEKLNK